MLPGAAALRLVGGARSGTCRCAPLFTVAATALSAIVMSAVGIAWSPVGWAVVMAVLVAFAALAGRLLTPARCRATQPKFVACSSRHSSQEPS